MSHVPQPKAFGTAVTLEAPALSNESKFYIGVLIFSLIALVSHAVVSLATL